MRRITIAVADASRARLFAYERTATPGGLHEELTELTDLINPAPREAHDDELDDEFARTIVDAIDAQLRATRPRRLIICASTRMLGRLRDAHRGAWPGAPEVDEVPRNVVRLSGHELRAYLGRRYLLPARASFDQASMS
ncbi:MAG TPA: host attachment protein [Kofleriaceae bacterium]|nr:host attachment protein [Kofleriaceae bacterium]